jgi:hypothetical protein
MTAPGTLADLEALCTAARAKGFGDDAEVWMPNVLAMGLTIVEPYVEPSPAAQGDT